MPSTAPSLSHVLDRLHRIIAAGDYHRDHYSFDKDGPKPMKYMTVAELEQEQQRIQNELADLEKEIAALKGDASGQLAALSKATSTSPIGTSTTWTARLVGQKPIPDPSMSPTRGWTANTGSRCSAAAATGHLTLSFALGKSGCVSIGDPPSPCLRRFEAGCQFLRVR